MSMDVFRIHKGSIFIFMRPALSDLFQQALSSEDVIIAIITCTHMTLKPTYVY